ncbi:T9SS type A sorting domain-containing protein [Hymenobacter sediminicola]|uniref:T9SS type A sorting domain-containing protein n=1 Tax=Hymenobacter sediminicola TaxID=2761579 RepID=A0A7G7W3S9_9BACT|nr:T9SS type A sorting domain-containing protein [Hymenobacter sediminicola]QNH61022.1 T9SS type A sorting domain-containing protein [Hymenobacter sediminicola]
MRKTLLAFLLLACGHDLLAQLPTNSFAVTSACPASAGNPSVLQQVNTDGSLTPIGTVTDGTTPIILNALGSDDNNLSVVYGLNVQQPITVSNINTPPNLYRVDLATAQATNLGAVTPPASPGDVTTPTQSGESGFYDARLTLNFIGDGDANSNYYVAGATFRVFYVFDLSFPFPFLRPVRVSDLRLYVGVIPLATFPATPPTWNRLDTSDPATAAVIAGYQAEVQAFLTSNGALPVPEGGIQDWVFDVRSGNLISYLGKDDKFITISTPATNPVGITTQPASPIPTQQNIGSMFTDRDGNIYAVDADGGTIYKIDRLTGNYSGSSYGAAFGCSRGDAVSLPGALPLPVKLKSFSAKASNGSVRINWATASEEHAESFLIQRSRTGTDWQTVQTVKAGNRPAGQSYSALDSAPLAGQSYYRLGMRDTDGSTAYSPAQAVSLTDKLVVQTFPNPATGRFTVLLSAASDAGTSVELLTPTGQLVRRFQPEAGTTSFPFDALGLPDGLYYLRVKQTGSMQTVPIVLVPESSR